MFAPTATLTSTTSRPAAFGLVASALSGERSVAGEAVLASKWQGSCAVFAHRPCGAESAPQARNFVAQLERAQALQLVIASDPSNDSRVNGLIPGCFGMKRGDHPPWAGS